MLLNLQDFIATTTGKLALCACVAILVGARLAGVLRAVLDAGSF